MRTHLPWLSQGDIFTAVPVVTVAVRASGGVEANFPTGPAVLLNHDCAMDKASKAGKPNIKTLHFCRLIAVSVQDDARKRTLRESGITPYEVMYLGECGSFGESFITISEMYPLPTDYFAPNAIEWPNHDQAASGDRYCTPSVNGDRIGRIDEDQVSMLRNKLNAFWTRLLPKE